MTALTLQSPELTDDSRWQAVLERDPQSVGAFVYGVRSTGIFCRPTCPSRKPRREGVQFFADADEAERAGYRACRRCFPRDVDPMAALVAETCRYLDGHLDDRVTLRALGREMAVDPFHLQRTFKRITGVTPQQYVDARRLDRFRDGARNGEGVAQALFAAGYGSSRALYERAPSMLGMAPGRYRRGGKGTHMVYAIVQCPLGLLLVAATDIGISAVQLGDEAARLEASLRAEYPAADLERDDFGLGEWIEQILRFLAGQEPHLDLPLDIQATAFQRRVWQELQRIPYGTIRAYTDIAEALGKPHAVRAVARACAVNPVSLVVPCHRVVRRDGALAGYRWGLERKRALQSMEHGEG